jgi:hypothetical protein
MFKSKKILLAALSFALFLGGCKEDEVEVVEPGNTLTARAGADQNVKVGDVVSLDGSGSTEKDNKPFDYRWAFSKKPAGSAANLSNPAIGKPTFTVDLPGEYELELTISNANGESKDKVLITAAVIEPIALDANIKTKMVLEDRINNPALPDYVVNANVSVNAELEIKPGVVIAFARDTRLEVNDNGGILLAKGDSLKPIRLIGKESTKGFWSGIIFRSQSTANTLEWVEIAHAGSKQLFSGKKAALGLASVSKAQLSIKHCLFEKNDGYGVFVEHGALLGAFVSNTFKDNTESGIILDAPNVGRLDYNSIFTGGNGRNAVEIMASSLSKNVTTEVVWGGFKDKTPYRVLESLSVEGNLKLMPGVILEMSRDSRLSVDEGYINAKGTQASKIIIRGVENQPAYWRGIICFSTSQLNVFEYAEISGGGSIALVSGKKTNIAVYGSQAKMQIRNSKISGSGGYGLYVNYQASINDDFETANTFEDNVQGKLLKE